MITSHKLISLVKDCRTSKTGSHSTVCIVYVLFISNLLYEKFSCSCVLQIALKLHSRLGMSSPVSVLGLHVSWFHPRRETGLKGGTPFYSSGLYPRMGFFLAPFAESFHLVDSRCRSFFEGIRLKISLSSQYVRWSPSCSLMELKYGFLTGCGYFLWFTIMLYSRAFPL